MDDSIKRLKVHHWLLLVFLVSDNGEFEVSSTFLGLVILNRCIRNFNVPHWMPLVIIAYPVQPLFQWVITRDLRFK